MKMARPMTTRPMTVMSRSMMVTTRRRESRSRRPQYWAVMTAVPLPTPMQKMWKRLVIWLAREEAEIWASPSLASITVSIRLTPMVMALWSTTGTPMASMVR